MSSQRDDYRWLGDLLVAVMSVCLSLLVWCVSGLGGYAVRCYRRHGGRPGLTAAATGLALALIGTGFLAVIERSAAALTLAAVSLAGWLTAVAVLSALYDAYDRHAARRLEQETLADVLSDDPWRQQKSSHRMRQ